MAYEHTEAIVLRKVDFSETSVIVTFLTQDRGRMACMARGARRKGSPLNTGLDTFNRLELTYAWKDSRQVQNLIEVSVIEAYGFLKRDIRRSASAAFVLEAALRASFEHQPVPELYAALAGGLRYLSDKAHDPFTAAVECLYALLEASGIAPGVADEESRLFLPRFSGMERGRIQNALRCLSTEGTLTEPVDAPVLIDFLHDYFTHHFETRLKSYVFLKSVLRDG